MDAPCSHKCSLLQPYRFTHEEGLSPLLAFGLAQGIISFVVALSSIVGKCLFALDPSNDAVRAIHTIAIRVAHRNDAHSRNEPSEECTRKPPRTNGFDSKYHSDKEHGSRHRRKPGNSRRGQRGIPQKRSNKYGLTMREFEVLGYLAKGRSYPRIAEELFITTGTVKAHRRHIHEKLGVKTKQELIDFVEKSS